MANLAVLKLRVKADAYTYLWFKSVEGFEPAHHCARSFKGVYSKGIPFGAIPVGREVVLSVDPRGAFHYLCGVVKGRNYPLNLHLPLAASASGEPWRYEDDRVVVEDPGGAFEVLRLGRVACSEVREEFLSCRNWQFGMRYFCGAEFLDGAGALPPGLQV